MNTKSLSNLITSVRQRADMVGSAFVSDSEITDYINQSLAELHDLLVTLFEDYYVESVDIALPAGNPTTLPDGSGVPKGFYKALGVDNVMGGVKYSVPPYLFAERNAYHGTGGSARGGLDLFYHIQGDQIRFIPESTASGTATLWYVPEPQLFDIAAPTTQLNVVARHIARGYEEFIILDAAIKCLLKEESDVKILLAQRELVRSRIAAAASTRESGAPHRIADVTSGTYGSSHINWIF